MHALAPTPFHCATAALSKLEDELTHHSLYGHAIILVVGTTGSGRSHLASRLQVLLSRSLPAGVVEAHPMLSEEQLDADALTQLGLHQLAAGGLGLASAVTRAPAGRRVLLIDNAHDLHGNILRELLLTAASEGKREDPRLLLILFGDEVLDAVLADIDYAGLEADDFRRVVMPLLQTDDARRMALLWAAAHNYAEPEPAQVAHAITLAHGHPGPFLEALAVSHARAAAQSEPESFEQDEDDYEPVAEFAPAMAAAAKGDDTDELLRTETSASLRPERMAGPVKPPFFDWLKTSFVIVAFLALALLLLYQEPINAWLAGAPAATVTTAEQTLDQTAEGARTELALTGTDTETETGVETGTPDATTAPALVTAVEAEPTESRETLDLQPAETAVSAAAAVAPAPVSGKPTTANPVVKQAISAPPAAVQPLPVKPVTAKPVATPAPVQTSVAANTSAASKPAAKVETAVKPELKPAVSGAAKRADFSVDEQALLNASPEHWVVQIVGLSDEAAMRAFIDQHGLSKARYYRALHKSKSWFVLVLAEFADHGAAVSARDALPAPIAAMGPWLKPVKAVQQEIQAAGARR